MAYLSKQNCFRCGEVTNHINGQCSNCSSKQNAEELDKWKAKTIDEKLLDLHSRLKALERGPARF